VETAGATALFEFDKYVHEFPICITIFIYFLHVKTASVSVA